MTFKLKRVLSQGTQIIIQKNKTINLGWIKNHVFASGKSIKISLLATIGHQ